MTAFSSYDITTDGPKFVPEVVADKNFVKDGYLYGHNGHIYWAAVDPITHPLYVWRKSFSHFYAPTYLSSAESLNAAVFSDGPLMTLPRHTKPYGPVHSDKHSFSSRGGNALDPWLYLLGRKKPAAGGIVFSDYVIASALAAPMTAGSAPIYATAAGFAEVCIGLYPLIVGGAALSSVPPPGGPPLGPAPGSNYNQSFANFLTGSSGIVAWALVGPPKCDGLIVVAGSPNLEPPRLPKRPSQYHYTQHYQTIARLNAQQNQAIVDALVAIGASAAVAMDGSDSVMLGEHSEAWFSPGFLKKVWLRYGFSCGGN